MGTLAQRKFTSIAIDLCSDNTQISYQMGNMTEPESVSTVPNEQKYLIPTIVGKIMNTSQWCIGDEAILRGQRGESENATDLVKSVLQEKVIVLEDIQYKGEDLLYYFIQGLFVIVKQNYKLDNPDRIVVTVEYPDRILVNTIRKILNKFGFQNEQIKVIGHSESMIYYTIFQKKELWVNDVLVFDYTENQFMVRRLNVVRARKPIPVIVEEEDLSKKFSIEDLKSNEKRKKLDLEFKSILEELCGKHIVSSAFLTGIGFYEKWMDESLKYLCSKRRVFQGYNLFVKGAGYAALCMYDPAREKDYQFVCSGRTLLNLNVVIEKGDGNIPLMLSKAGTNWFEAGARIEGILDQTKEITFEIESSLSKKKAELSIDLSEFPLRPNKLTRIEIIVAYKNDRQCIIQVKDLGFGEFYKASENVIKKIINIEEYL